MQYVDVYVCLRACVCVVLKFTLIDTNKYENCFLWISLSFPVHK